MTNNSHRSRLTMFETVSPNKYPRSFSNSSIQQYDRSGQEKARLSYQQYSNSDSTSRRRNLSSNFRTENSRGTFNGNNRSFLNSNRRQEGTASRSNAKSLICWNCKKLGHTYRDCCQGRSKFCYRCGQPNVTVTSSKRCSENA